jgi:hypothetical protein
MPQFLPPPTATIPAGGAGPSIIAFDPGVVNAAAAQVQNLARELRSCAPALLSTWEQASGGLPHAQTGQVLAACRPAAASILEACAGALEALASSLRHGGLAYATAGAVAVPATNQAFTWLP